MVCTGWGTGALAPPPYLALPRGGGDGGMCRPTRIKRWVRPRAEECARRARGRNGTRGTVQETGATTVFFMTDFWSAAGMSRTKETQQGKNVVDGIKQCLDQVQRIPFPAPTALSDKPLPVHAVARHGGGAGRPTGLSVPTGPYNCRAIWAWRTANTPIPAVFRASPLPLSWAHRPGRLSSTVRRGCTEAEASVLGATARQGTILRSSDVVSAAC